MTEFVQFYLLEATGNENDDEPVGSAEKNKFDIEPQFELSNDENPLPCIPIFSQLLYQAFGAIYSTPANSSCLHLLHPSCNELVYTAHRFQMANRDFLNTHSVRAILDNVR